MLKVWLLAVAVMNRAGSEMEVKAKLLLVEGARKRVVNRESSGYLYAKK